MWLVLWRIIMISGGVSLMGTYHDKNQDSFACNVFDFGSVCSVSDGLGSKLNSEIGSKAICETVLEVSNQFKGNFENPLELLQQLHFNWLQKLKDYCINSCYATILFCIVLKDRLFMARLGDGFISSITDENVVTVLFDDKSEHFVNETDCLTEMFEEKYWDYKIVPFNTFQGVICSSDGIGLNNKNIITNFTKDFIQSYSTTLSSDSVECDVSRWLSDWTGSDDKTITFLLNSSVEGEKIDE